MKKKKLLIFPFGGSARETLLTVFAVNELFDLWDVMGFIDDDEKKHGKDCCGVRVLGGKDVLRKMKDTYVLAAPADPQSYLKKKPIIDSLKLAPDRFATVIHPSAEVSPDAKIGYNTVIMNNCFISAGVSVGNHNIILPNTVISHDSKVGSYCFIGSNVSISGSVTVKDNSFIASGVTLRDHILVGEKTFIGLGSNVIRDVREGTTVIGNPAKEFKRKS